MCFVPLSLFMFILFVCIFYAQSGFYLVSAVVIDVKINTKSNSDTHIETFFLRTAICVGM
jgi:hypothetical protein